MYLQKPPIKNVLCIKKVIINNLQLKNYKLSFQTAALKGMKRVLAESMKNSNLAFVYVDGLC